MRNRSVRSHALSCSKSQLYADAVTRCGIGLRFAPGGTYKAALPGTFEFVCVRVVKTTMTRADVTCKRCKRGMR